MVEKTENGVINVFISPNYLNTPANLDNGGIRRVVEAENKYLEQFGVKSVAYIQDADVIQNQGGMQTWRKGIPIVNTSHGMMWSRYPWGQGIQEVNQQLVNAMAMAVAHTAPSEWVARAIRRGGFFYPEVVYHGVDSTEFTPPVSAQRYVLWNKARADFVSDPKDMQKLAALLPDVQFFTTIGNETSNVRVLGVRSYEEMKTLVAQAGVYLCTARETFGIGTLEAMACGVPIAGWDWGGQSEIVIPGETGYLAPPGRFDVLIECVKKCLEERERLSVNCVEDARMRWKWEPRIKQYADLFKEVYADAHKKRPTVTVIVTAYKLDQYLGQCLKSVAAQTMDDFECLVVDDALSADTKRIVTNFSKGDKRFKYVLPPEHLGLVGARNYGFSKSKGRYIRHLDADDWLAENALALEAAHLDDHPGIHITWGHLCLPNADGVVPMSNGSPTRADWPPPQFDWLAQMAHLNQIPSCAMTRREVFVRTGGYRVRHKRQEDADFNCRATSLGFRAEKATEAITYFHRGRSDSKGQMEWNTEGREPDWTAWFPWGLGAKDYREGVNILRKCQGLHPAPELVPFGAQGKNWPEKFWYVHDFSYPYVSIIVTCGPGHKEYLIDALDSIQSQTLPDWECVVVNDTGEKWGKYIPGAPWAKVVNMDGNQGTAAARNEGLKHGRGRCVFWMDADDYWLPWYLERMVAYAEQNKGIIFSDLIQEDVKGVKKIYTYKDVVYPEIPFHMSYPGSSIMVPRDVAKKVVELQGGFDPNIPGMEDWDYQIAAHSLGVCAHHLPEPLFVYRTFTSTKREHDYDKIDLIRDYLDKKWPQYRKDGQKLMCGCQGTKKVTAKPGSTLSSAGEFPNKNLAEMSADASTMVRLEYVGPNAETFSIRSIVDRGVLYRFGNNEFHKQRDVFNADAQRLIQITGGDGKPIYRILNLNIQGKQYDPADVIGTIAA